MRSSGLPGGYFLVSYMRLRQARLRASQPGLRYMVLHSVHYLAFLLVSVLVTMRSRRARWIPLLAASGPSTCRGGPSRSSSCSLLRGSVRPCAPHGPELAKQRRRPYLLASLAAGLGVLIFFKYRWPCG